MALVETWTAEPNVACHTAIEITPVYDKAEHNTTLIDALGAVDCGTGNGYFFKLFRVR